MKLMVPILMLVCLLPMLLSAQNPLTFTTNSGAITITGYVGSSSGITNVVIPDAINGYPVTRIGSFAFQNCTSLTNMVIGNNLTNIGNSAFQYCGLTSVVIPNSVRSIGFSAFLACDKLTNVAIGNSVTNIGNSAFAYCSGLTWVVIPASVTSIGNSALAVCASLTNITVNAANAVYSSTNGVLFNKTQTRLVACPAGVRGSYVIPASVTSIGNLAFSRCLGLTNVVIPNSVMSIENSAFSDCTDLRNIMIPASVTSIGDGVFYYCSSLTNITFRGNAPDLGLSVFTGVAAGSKVYYYYGADGWGATYGDLPTVMLYWPPQISSGSVGIQSGKFGFTISSISNQTVTVEASTNLMDWVAIQEITSSGTNADFSDSQWANYPSRFYRVRTGGLPPPTSLTLTNLSGTTGNQMNFVVTVPAGKTSLQISTFGGSGDCDLYVKFGSAPTTLSWDYRSILGGNYEAVTVSNPAAGSWYIMLRAFSTYSDVTLEVQ